MGDAQTNAASGRIEEEMRDKRWWVLLSRTRQVMEMRRLGVHSGQHVFRCPADCVRLSGMVPM